MSRLAILLSFLSLCFVDPSSAKAQGGITFYDKYNQVCDTYEAEYFAMPPIQDGDVFQYIMYYTSGIKKETGTYSSLDSGGIKDGYVSYFDTLGHLWGQGFYVSNKKAGHWKYYYRGTKQLWYEEDYKEPGSEELELTSYYPDSGVKRKETRVQNNKLGKIEVTGKCYDKAGNEVPFTPFEKMPKYPGGDAAAMLFMRKNLRYPDGARENNIQGRVTVRFVVTETGALSDIEVAKSIHPELDWEAIRIISAMPDWSPGLQDDKPVKTYFSLPISFTLE